MASLVEKAFGAYLRLHDTVYQRTNGWIGHRMMLMPSLLLHTIGAKTGKARTTSLTYGRDGDDYLVVASKGGSPRAPDWYHNLKANPNVEINVGPRRFGVLAHPVVPGDPSLGFAANFLYTLTGKKMEVPVRKILMGWPVDKAVSRDAMSNPESVWDATSNGPAASARPSPRVDTHDDASSQRNGVPRRAGTTVSRRFTRRHTTVASTSRSTGLSDRRW